MNEATGGYRFGPFTLDPADRRVSRGGQRIEISGRYFDALALLVAERGRLVSKDRFMDEVWRGVPVTDEALTQCIRSLRRALGDDAAAPRIIETVPRHGYRMIAPVEDAAPTLAADRPRTGIATTAIDAGAGAFGGALAGIIAAIGYLGLGLVTPGIGTASTLLVLVSVNIALGLLSGAVVGAGAVLAGRRCDDRAWALTLGGALGGLVVGSLGSALGRDLFSLFFGRDPGAITGAWEGLVLGGMTGLAIAISISAERRAAVPRLAGGFALGALAGAVIAAAGGHLMAGSLAELAAHFPETNMAVGTAPHGGGIGALTLGMATVVEAALFAGCVAAAIGAARTVPQGA